MFGFHSAIVRYLQVAGTTADARKTGNRLRNAARIL